MIEKLSTYAHKALAAYLMPFAFLSLMPAAHAADQGLLIWINGDKAYRGLASVGQKFTTATRVKVTVDHPDDASGKFERMAAAGGGPDIWIWAHDRIGTWAKKGLIQPIQPSATLKGNMVSMGWEAFTFDGKIWGYPLALESIGLIYNKDLVKGPPSQFEFLPQIDKELSAKGVKAIAWDYNNTYFSWPLLAAGGAYPFGKDIRGNYNARNTGVNSAGAVKGAQFISDLVRQGVLPPADKSGYDTMMSAMKNRKVAMIINGPWAWQELSKAKINFGVAKLPSFNGQPAKPFIGVLGVMINQNSPNKEAAKDFIENYLLKPEGIRTLNNDVKIGVPAEKTLFREIFLDEKFRGTMENIYQGKPMPPIDEMAQFWSAMGPALTAINAGTRAPKPALDQAAKRIISGK